MTPRCFSASALALALFLGSSGLAEAQHSRGGGSPAVGRAVPRGGSVGGPAHPVYPGGGPVRPGYPGGGYYYRPYYRPYYGYYGYYGYPYGYYPFGFSIGIGFGWGYPYGGYGYWGYPYGGYGYPAYSSSYGGVRIQNAPKDSAVYADGYYVGTVDDFDGSFQQLNLEAGPHHIEIMREGAPPASVDVNIRPGQTVTFRAN